MLYGMADPIKDVLVGHGSACTVYTPYGDLLPGMAYLVRRLLENTANESFLRASFSEHVPEDQLLRDPRLAGSTGLNRRILSSVMAMGVARLHGPRDSRREGHPMRRWSGRG